MQKFIATTWNRSLQVVLNQAMEKADSVGGTIVQFEIVAMPNDNAYACVALVDVAEDRAEMARRRVGINSQ